MQSTLGQIQDRALVQRGADMRVTVSTNVKEIPYDYVAIFPLEGVSGRRVQQVINITAEAPFVADTISYSFIPAKFPEFRLELERSIDSTAGGRTPVGIAPSPDAPLQFPASLLEVTAQALAIGLGRVTQSNPNQVRNSLLTRLQNNVFGFLIDEHVIQKILLRICGIDFKYSIVDSGSGRELQNLAIHNIAGLGESTGERPFRSLAKPVFFLPRSTIRIEVEELSVGPLYGYDEIDDKGDKTGRRVGSELHIVLHGYKILGNTG